MRDLAPAPGGVLRDSPGERTRCYGGAPAKEMDSRHTPKLDRGAFTPPTVEVEQSAEPLSSLDPAARICRGLCGLDQYVPRPLVVPLEPIVLHEFIHRLSQVRLSQWNDPAVCRNLPDAVHA
jgi:hypothetical protein